MKKVAIILVIMMLAVFGGTICVNAGGFEITAPFETGVTAFYFPTDNTIAGGVSETVLRLRYNDETHLLLQKLSLDLDGTLAQEINVEKDTLYGLGVKLNYDTEMLSNTGIVFQPSVGVTALRNMKGINTVSDIFREYKIAVYGNIVLYRFQ